MASSTWGAGSIKDPRTPALDLAIAEGKGSSPLTDFTTQLISEQAAQAKEKRIEQRLIDREGRADTRQIAKEDRQLGVLAGEQVREDKLLKEKQAYDKPYRDAQIAKLKSEKGKADRWMPSATAASKKKYLSDDDAISYKQEATTQYNSDKQDLLKGKSTHWWTWDDSTGKYNKDGKEMSIDDALAELEAEYAKFTSMIDSKTQSGASSPQAKTTGRPTINPGESKEDYLARLKTIKQGK